MTCRRFTLIEVLVALLVVAAVIPVALHAIGVAARLNAAAATQQQAVGLAELKLQELLVAGTWRDGDQTGDFGNDHPGYRWELSSAVWTAVDLTMRRLELSVYAPGRAEQPAATLSTLVPETTSS